MVSATGYYLGAHFFRIVLAPFTRRRVIGEQRQGHAAEAVGALLEKATAGNRGWVEGGRHNYSPVGRRLGGGKSRVAGPRRLGPMLLELSPTPSPTFVG